MTEALTLAKYPSYAAYQQSTSRLLPWFPGPSLDSAEGKLIARNASVGTTEAKEQSAKTASTTESKKERRRSKSSKSQ
jgi:hypothetical protein